jgi:tripartite-type tricarboxylate transporter receptor subunit TctC
MQLPQGNFTINGVAGIGLLRALAVAFAAVAAVAHAQSQDQRLDKYPSRPIRMLVGNAPGGGVDITARVVAQNLSERLNRSIVVDNRPGASGIVAMDLAAQASADGYTLLVSAGSLLGSAMVQKKVRYDVRKAFAPITQFNSLCYMLLVNASLPVNSIKELIAYAKNKPNALSYGSSGVGASGHLGGELLNSMAGIKMVHVPYKGSSPVMVAMISGQVQLGFASTIAGMPHVKSGKLRVLGVTSPQRTRAFPDLPTIAEAGVPGFEVTNWYGLFAPDGTPLQIVTLLHREATQALASPGIQATFANDGADATPSRSPAEFRRVLAQEIEKWEKIVKLPGFAESLR